MASEVIRILNHETLETHERESGTTNRLPVVFSTSKFAPKILTDRYGSSVHRPVFARPILIV